MMKNTLLFYFSLVSLLTFSCGQDNSLRNKIVFNDAVSSVSDSIERMGYLMSKLPQEGIVRYAISSKGFLYLNKNKFEYTIGDVISDELKNDVIFDRFKRSEADEFFSLLDYLNRNHISYAHREPALGLVEFSYRAKSSETKENLRSIIFFRSSSDTTSIHFTQHYKVLDSKENLVLIGLK
jgi:hypothetical protein